MKPLEKKSKLLFIFLALTISLPSFLILFISSSFGVTFLFGNPSILCILNLRLVIFFVNIFDEDLLLISIFKSLDLSLEIPKTKLPEGEILRGFSSRKILFEGFVLPIINPP